MGFSGVTTYTKEVAQTEPYDPKKKFLNFLDKNYPNYFEKNGISKDEEEVIRAVLTDNNISENEARELSFEQAQILHKIEFNRFEYGPQNSVDMMLLPAENQKVQHILGVTDFTKNDTFNRAIHKTFVENSSLDDNEMMKIREELSYTLQQAYHGMKLGLNMHQAPTPQTNSTKIDISNFDYENYLVNLLRHIQIFSDKPNDPKTQEQYNLLMTNFGQILDNYKKATQQEQ
jgi:hypothetical protein